MRGSVAMDDFFREFAGDPEYERERALGSAHANLAINLLRLRRARGESGEAVAGRAGVPAARLRRLETGAGDPRLTTISRLAGALGVSAGDLLAEPPRIR